VGYRELPFKSRTDLNRPVSQRYRGRFAPSPTGALHFGSLVAAVGSWLRARRQQGDWILRVEDIDPPREVPGATASILATLAAFGMTSDEPVMYQHTRGDAYAAALACLVERGDAFACTCSRTVIRARRGHRGRCVLEPGDPRPRAWRMAAPDRVIAFDDAIQGHFSQDLQRDVGDFVLLRADGLWAYQLAVVIDDAIQGITEVVRGADLLDSTPRQILLQQALDLPTPAYAHLPALLGQDGQKLSKQTFATPVDPTDPMPALRQALAVLGIPRAAQSQSSMPEAVLTDAIAAFAFDRIAQQPFLRSATWQSLANG
jgi:glutamyl-Q tRNA(Asp) synthetase